MINFTKNLGLKLAAIWLILHGVMVFVPRFTFDGMPHLLAALAIAAGVLILLDR